MAEIRKHKTSASGLAAAVRAAIGDDVRPFSPGEDSGVPSGFQEAEPRANDMWFLTSGAERFLAPPEAVDAPCE